MKPLNPLPFCPLCRGRGYVRDKSTKRYEGCRCGRLPNAEGAYKLSQQHVKEERLKQIKQRGW